MSSRAFLEPFRLILMALAYAVVVAGAFLVSKAAHAAPTENCRDAAAQCALPSVPGAYSVEIIQLDFVFDESTWQVVSFTPRWAPVGLRAAGEVVDCASWGPFDASGALSPGSYGIWSGSQCRYELLYPASPASAPSSSASGPDGFTSEQASGVLVLLNVLASGVALGLGFHGFAQGARS